MLNTYLQDVNGFIAYFNFVQATAITRYTLPATVSSPPVHTYYGAVATTEGTCMFSYKASTLLTAGDYKNPWQFMNNVDVLSFDVKLYTEPVSNTVFALHTENNAVAICNVNTLTRLVTKQSMVNSTVKNLCIYPIANTSTASIFVVTEKSIEYWILDATTPSNVLVQQVSSFYIANVQMACGYAQASVVFAFAERGLGAFDFSTRLFQTIPYAQTLAINEVSIINNAYLVFTDGDYLCSQPINQIFNAPLQIQKSFSDLGIGNSLNNFDIRISDIPSDYADSVISFGTGDGIAKYDLVTNAVTEQFKSRDYPELGNLTDYSPTARKLVGLAATGLKVPFINFQYASLFSYAGHEMISQRLPINTRYTHQGVKLSIVIPTSSVLNGAINIYDDNNQGLVLLSKYQIVAGTVSGSGLGGGGKVCYFDAPIGITTKAFFVSIQSDVSNEEIKIYMDEV